jgi:predicted GNAT family N-acyltransferase
MNVVSKKVGQFIIRPINSAEELDAVARLRYQVYVNELGRRPEGCDDDLQRLIDPEDAYSIVLAAYDHDNIVGTFRITPFDQLEKDSSWQEIYASKKFPVDANLQFVFSRMIVTNDYRGSCCGRRAGFFALSIASGFPV